MRTVGFRQINARDIWAGEHAALATFAAAYREDCRGSDDEWRAVYGWTAEALGKAKRAAIDAGFIAPLVIEICPVEPRASIYLSNGESARGGDYERDVLDCTGPGDAQPACEYLRDRVGVEFRIVAVNTAGEYENRLATASEKEATARAIYFESESDFDDESTVEAHLIWQAASDVEAEESE